VHFRSKRVDQFLITGSLTHHRFSIEFEDSLDSRIPLIPDFLNEPPSFFLKNLIMKQGCHHHEGLKAAAVLSQVLQLAVLRTIHAASNAGSIPSN
jgi:hypothetical protein